MTIADVLTTIQDSTLAHAISKSNHLVAASLQVVHVLGFIALLAALVLLSLRLLGICFRATPLADVVRDANRSLYVGLTLTITSGVLMFIASPKLYYYKPAFELKMLLFLIAIGLQFLWLRRIAIHDTQAPRSTRAAVALSLAAWFGIGLAGRMIGFT
jgi:hypothetical protein